MLGDLGLDLIDRDAPLSELDGDATDFLD